MRGAGREGHEGLGVAWHEGHMARLLLVQTFALMFSLNGLRQIPATLKNIKNLSQIQC